MGYGEGLNLKISEASAQLDISYPTGFEEYQRCESSNPHWGNGRKVDPFTLKVLRETPCADPHAGCCGGWGRKTPGYPIMKPGGHHVFPHLSSLTPYKPLFFRE